jgi:SAM-dependent methyltransferase
MALPLQADHARATYDAFADHYDAFTAHHDYDDWMGTLERLAQRHGLRGLRLLDVACGTGKSFLPFLDRGYEVTACDVSPAMLRLARGKVGDRVELAVHDMRALPRLGSFDLVCCIDDAVNYLLTPEELRAALTAMRRNLAAEGVLVFDVNTLDTYRTSFAALHVVSETARVIVLEGHASAAFGAGELAHATAEVLEPNADGAWQRRRYVHHQRHHPREEIEAALAAAGLACAGAYGMHVDGTVTDEVDEHTNSKAVYIARHRA